MVCVSREESDNCKTYTLDPAIPLVGIVPKEIMTDMYIKVFPSKDINLIAMLINTMGYYIVVRSHITAKKHESVQDTLNGKVTNKYHYGMI